MTSHIYSDTFVKHQSRYLFLNENDRISPQKHPRRKVYLCRAAIVSVSSAELRRNPGNAVVALVAVLGSRSVEMPATQSSITHGSKAFELAKVL